METEAMDRAMDMAEKFGAKLAEIAAEHSGDAVDLAHAVARVDAAHQLIIGAVCAVLALTFFWVAARLLASAKRERDADAGTALTLIAFLSGIASIVLSIVATVNLATPWPWIGIIEPNIWIAKSILNL
jgi:hypothetical protein